MFGFVISYRTLTRSLRSSALLLALAAATAVPAAQARRGATPPATPPTPRTEPAMLNCPSILGDGLQSGRTYCDVQIGNDPAAGIIVTLPPHTGDVRLMFDLHNRHTYSEDLVKAKRSFTRYTASIGVMTMNSFLITRAAVLNEFRSADDLFDRVTGGSGPGGLKAVAPTGLEPISVLIPAENQAVSILGEKLSVVRLDDADNFTTQGRPIALISNVRVEYTPAPTAKPAPARGRK